MILPAKYGKGGLHMGNLLCGAGTLLFRLRCVGGFSLRPMLVQMNGTFCSRIRAMPGYSLPDQQGGGHRCKRIPAAADSGRHRTGVLDHLYGAVSAAYFQCAEKGREKITCFDYMYRGHCHLQCFQHNRFFQVNRFRVVSRKGGVKQTLPFLFLYRKVYIR